MKKCADKRRNAQESSIVVGNTVLLKQNRADRPNNKEFQEGRRRVICWCQHNSVIGVKGAMVTVKSGKDQSLELVTIQILKYAREKQYDVLDLDQNGPGNAQAEERTTLDAYLDSPSKDPPHSLP